MSDNGLLSLGAQPSTLAPPDADSAFSPDAHSDRRLRVTCALLIALGAGLSLLNLRWPVARNGLVYAKTALDILQHHFNLYAVVRDHALTGGKPILFSVVAAPFAWIWNANSGVVFASTLGTAFYLWSCALALPRINQIAGLDRHLEPLELVLVAFNPLTLYQFWSAYPDSLFAGLVVLSFVLTDVMAREPERDTRWHIAALGLTIFVAIHTKLYGAVLCISCPVYLLMQAIHEQHRYAYRWSKVITFCAVFAGLMLTILSARSGTNPLLALDPGAGFNDYLSGVGLADIKGALTMFAVAILLVFQLALFGLGPGVAWTAFRVAPTVFCSIYLVGLLPASGASFNIRYCLPAFVFLAPAIAAGIASLSRRLRRALLTAYGAIALVLILNFNVAAVERSLAPISVRVFGETLATTGLLENLRLPVHIALRQQIEHVNAQVPAGSILYWSSDYYGRATHDLAYDLGIKRDIDVRYVLQPTEPPPSPIPVFLLEFTSFDVPQELWRIPHWAKYRSLGYGLFRLDPISVDLVSLSGDSIEDGGTLRLRASINIGNRQGAGPINITEGGRVLATANSGSLEATLSSLTRGRHALLASASDGEGNVAKSDPIAVYVGVRALERVAEDTDDLVVEYRDGEVDGTHDLLSFDRYDQWVGIRFNRIAVAESSRVTDVRLGLTAASPQQLPTTLDIWGELSANARGLSRELRDLSRRQATTAQVTWSLDPWQMAGEHALSPNLAPILEEILSRPGWQSGNSIMLLLRISGEQRQVVASDLNGHEPPRLVVTLGTGR
jgi:hypothetical protein